MVNEHRVLIRPIIKSKSWARKFGYKKPIQNSLFRFGVKIKNIDNYPFAGATIKNILLYPAKDKEIVTNLEKTIKIQGLNPGEHAEIWIENVIVPFSGTAWASFEFEKEGKEDILTYQYDEANRCPSINSHKDKWVSTFSIIDENVLQQKITNILLIILTAVLAFSEITALILR